MQLAGAVATCLVAGVFLGTGASCRRQTAPVTTAKLQSGPVQYISFDDVTEKVWEVHPDAGRAGTKWDREVGRKFVRQVMTKCTPCEHRDEVSAALTGAGYSLQLEIAVADDDVSVSLPPAAPNSATPPKDSPAVRAFKECVANAFEEAGRLQALKGAALSRVFMVGLHGCCMRVGEPEAE
jgi:hypothetical protein